MKAERLARSGRHDRQRIATIEDRPDEIFLTGAKRLMAEVMMKSGEEIQFNEVQRAS